MLILPRYATFAEREKEAKQEPFPNAVVLLVLPHLRINRSISNFGFRLWICACPILLSELVDRSEWQVDPTYNEMVAEMENNYLINVSAFSPVTLRWFTGIRMKINAKSTIAYTRALSSTRWASHFPLRWVWGDCGGFHVHFVKEKKKKKKFRAKQERWRYCIKLESRLGGKRVTSIVLFAKTPMEARVIWMVLFMQISWSAADEMGSRYGLTVVDPLNIIVGKVDVGPPGLLCLVRWFIYLVRLEKWITQKKKKKKKKRFNAKRKFPQILKVSMFESLNGSRINILLGA